jgi:Mg2+ and Co2+ transporter CorA
MSPSPDSSAGPPRDLGAELLPRSIFVREEDPRREAREAVDAILSDAFMGFLAILLIPIIVLPIFVVLPPTLLSLFDFGDYTIIGFFVVEYLAKFYLAADRYEFVRSPWHLLDLAVILISFASYVPAFDFGKGGSAILLLRLLRLARVFAVGGRAAGARVSHEEAKPVAVTPPPVLLRQIDPSHLAEPRDLSWDELEQHLTTASPEWINISNASEEALLRVSRMLRVPQQQFRFTQLDDLWPHVGRVERTMLMFLQSGEIRYPKRSREFYTIARRGAIAVVQGPKVITVTPHGLDPFARVPEMLQEPLATEPGSFVLKAVEGLLDSTLKDYRALLAEIELEVARIGRTPRSRLPKDFLARTYELHKAISRLSSNFLHLKELVNRLVAGRAALPALDERTKDRFEALADETGYMTEIAKDAQDNLGTVIDVYINQSSFDTNRILKILAVITAVAIIPSAVGGLLGINPPYILELWVVVLSVGLSMLFVTYCFLKLGWLRV